VPITDREIMIFSGGKVPATSPNEEAGKCWGEDSYSISVFAR
jgi:hypothetical protein